MKVVVIGGGPAGMMCACKIAENCKNEVVLIEKNEKLGKKLYITGKGRCNVTNNKTGETFLQNVVRNPKFVLSSEKKFDSLATMKFFEDLGVKLKVERGDRVFPVSDKSSDIIRAFEKCLKQRQVEILLSSKVTKILSDGKTARVMCGTKTIVCDAVVVATGGVSYPATGSTGDGYDFAEKFGHEIVEPVASLVPILLNGNEPKALEGLSLKNVALGFVHDGKLEDLSEIGELVFTSDGVSGPLVLTASSKFCKQICKNDILFIDFKPALDKKQLEARIDRDIDSDPKKHLRWLIEGMLPSKMVDVFLKRLKLIDKQVNQLTKGERLLIIGLLKKFEFEIVGLAPIEQAVVTCGGVNVKDIKPQNMQSKLVPNIYFVGEVLDIDAYTGGYNIQLALSTGFACGEFLKGDIV